MALEDCVERFAMIEEMRVALESLVDALVREGLERHDAREEAAEYVSIPCGRSLSEKEINLFVSSVGEDSLSTELVRLISAGQIQGAAVWDVDFRSGGIDDGIEAFREFVESSTSVLVDTPPGLPRGVVIGACGDADWVWVSADGGVYLVDHEDGSSLQVASSLRAFVAVNARLAASYYSLLNREAPVEDWAASIIQGVTTEGVDPGWIEHSVLSRPRPD